MEEIKVSEMLQADSINKDDSVMIIQEGVNKKASGSIQTATGTSLSLTSVADTCKVKSNSKNLFDSDNPKSIFVNGSTIYTNIANGIRVTKTATGVGFILFEIKDITNDVGKTFTLRADFTSTGHYMIGLADASGGNRISGASTTTSGEALSYTIPEITTSSKLVIWLYGPDGATGDIDYTNIQLEEGSTATSYNPYNTEVGIFGKNVFDQSQIKNPPVDGNGRKIQLTLKPNTQYTMSTNCPTSTQGSTLIFFASGTSIDGLSTWTNGVWNGQTRTFTSDANGNMVVAYRRQTGDDNINLTDYWYQIEEGSTATTYEKFEGQYLDLIPNETKSAFTYDSLTNILSNGSVTIEYNTQSRLLNNDDVLDIVEPVKEYTDTITNGTILYEDANGSNGTIALKDNINNYKSIDIFFTPASADGRLGYGRYDVGLATGLCNLSSMSCDAGSSMYIRSKDIQLSGTSISTYGTRYCSVIIDTGSGGSTRVTRNASNEIYIKKVVGYK